MDTLPIQYLHLETVVLPVFLVMVLFFQLARSSDPGYYIPRARKQMYWFLAVFGLLTCVFTTLLAKISPLLAVELSAGCVLSLFHPVNALCFFVHLLYLRPWEIATTNALLLALPRGIAGLCFFVWLIYSKRSKPNAQTLHQLNFLLVFSGWLFFTTFFTPDIIETQLDWMSTYFKSLIVFVMCIFFIDGERSVSEFEWTIVISTFALIVVGLYQFLAEGTLSGRMETIGMLGNSNDLAAIVILAFPFALVPVFRKSAGLSRQMIGILFAGFSVIAIWFTKSRGAMFALLVQAIAAQAVKQTRIKWFSLLLLAGVLGAGYFVALKAIPRAAADMEESKESRIAYWKAAVNMTLHHPVWGVGFDQYPDNFDSYSSGTLYEWGKRTAHSSWLLAFAESGIIGGLLFMGFFVSILRTAWRNRLRWPAQLYALIGYGIAMSFLSHTYGLYFYLLAGLISASNSLKEETQNVA